LRGICVHLYRRMHTCSKDKHAILVKQAIASFQRRSKQPEVPRQGVYSEAASLSGYRPRAACNPIASGKGRNKRSESPRRIVCNPISSANNSLNRATRPYIRTWYSDDVLEALTRNLFSSLTNSVPSTMSRSLSNVLIFNMTSDLSSSPTSTVSTTEHT
jgi:hypothetical protein